MFLGSVERWLKYGSREPPHVDQWAMYASSLLTGQAEAHFAAVTRTSGVDLSDMSWDIFCDTMKNAYSRIEQDFAARVGFHEIEQKSDQDVNGLVREMRELLGKMDGLPDAKTQAFMLVNALKENIRKATMRQAPRGGSWASFDEAAEAAVVAEADLRRNRLLSSAAEGQTDEKKTIDQKRSYGNHAAKSGRRDERPREQSRGFGAGRGGGVGAGRNGGRNGGGAHGRGGRGGSPNKRPRREDWTPSGPCYTCGGRGHVAKDCPSPAQSRQGGGGAGAGGASA